MADINLQGLWESKEREFSGAGAGLVRLEENFLNAVNRSINRINSDADLETRITRISSITDSVSLDEKYEEVLSDLVSVELIKAGQRPAKGFEKVFAELKADAVAGIHRIYTDIMNAAQDADTDDTVSRVGLGGKG